MTRWDSFPGVDTSRRVAAACLAGACAGAATIWRFGWTPPLPAYCYFAGIATVVCATDLAARRIPNRVVLPAYLIGPALLALSSALTESWWELAQAGIAMGVLGGFYLVLGLAFPSGMGFGDVKWGGLIGAYLGWLGWSAVLNGTVVAFVAAALFVSVRRVRLGRPQRLTVPLAPFMTGGAALALVLTPH